MENTAEERDLRGWWWWGWGYSTRLALTARWLQSKIELHCLVYLVSRKEKCELIHI